MSFQLNLKKVEGISQIELPYSKSISNRVLILSALAEEPFEIINLSKSEDTEVLQKALKSQESIIDVGMAGTAYRFLTAFYSLQKGTKVLTGAERMKNRPIAVLVEALIHLGVSIEYMEKDGFPPLKITGKELSLATIEMKGNVSSQFISALILIGSRITNGLKVELTGEIVSKPYIEMTIELLTKVGGKAVFADNSVRIEERNLKLLKPLTIERDWSSAAFFYQVVLFSGQAIFLNGLTSESIQGDKRCVEIFSELGVETIFNERGAFLRKVALKSTDQQSFDLTDCPDLIPSLAVAVSQFIGRTEIAGTKTLYLKECNRVEALKNELRKLNVDVIEIGKNSIEVRKAHKNAKEEQINFESYNDHRIAMCLAPLRILYNQIEIDNVEVVGKSFPSYWVEMEKVGISKNLTS